MSRGLRILFPESRGPKAEELRLSQDFGWGNHSLGEINPCPNFDDVRQFSILQNASRRIHNRTGVGFSLATVFNNRTRSVIIDLWKK
jgi:hypothetical protein